MSAPFKAQWDGESFKPLRRFHNQMSATFVIGEEYDLVEEMPRSKKSHDHFFASVAEAWMNLPDPLADQFMTGEHFRKFALIKCGYADSRHHVCQSKAEAVRCASFVKPMDTYALVTVTDCVVTVYTAKSQSKKAMGAKVFQESKTKVLEYISDLLGVAPDKLTKSRAA